MAENKIKKQEEQLNEQQLDDVTGGRNRNTGQEDEEGLDPGAHYRERRSFFQTT
ncbi:hypothetical protein [Xylanibacter ruminicola]|uniref:Uncharacterized protein n=1 Tax=Xylanibacter ruminicola TaxID=839 RepID=A0A1M6UY88_XYLRU|nr:hypothetical protein [Xylanibacter ruminicola]SHK74160.1 hypothetical protein SAMN05216463_11112 [Xylanibacter ruminicola]